MATLAKRQSAKPGRGNPLSKTRQRARAAAAARRTSAAQRAVQAFGLEDAAPAEQRPTARYSTNGADASAPVERRSPLGTAGRFAFPNPEKLAHAPSSREVVQKGNLPPSVLKRAQAAQNTLPVNEDPGAVRPRASMDPSRDTTRAAVLSRLQDIEASELLDGIKRQLGRDIQSDLRHPLPQNGQLSAEGKSRLNLRAADVSVAAAGLKLEPEVMAAQKQRVAEQELGALQMQVRLSQKAWELFGNSAVRALESLGIQSVADASNSNLQSALGQPSQAQAQALSWSVQQQGDGSYALAVRGPEELADAKMQDLKAIAASLLNQDPQPVKRHGGGRGQREVGRARAARGHGQRTR